MTTHRVAGVSHTRPSHFVLSRHHRVDNPSPDGDGVEFIKLRADPADRAVGDLSKFQITSLNFLDGQVLKLWDVTNYTTATATYSPSTTWFQLVAR
ncbi:uncharacterized protein ACA1_169740 [Acanthamoeba castellanii str. Neff]|uniref:Uncharacterized protein n=1 Tax=Acanthamoeba castellanii (strain ATCC 30010 / Neff) TaxID=1257118 RepID=L8HIP9_ACACF|nr:uncharacterized protein ACA1_169740 [Acanthamoeba castellanii str. Neff]ELR24276.1 hypothetical protein ACA1_169740 [Acanthamoeba castellanii str. Neff]